MRPEDLIDTARQLARASQRRPREADLRRAVSTSYYAVFHALCLTCADTIVGTTGADRSTPAWRQVYRALDHGFAKKQCESPRLSSFPEAVRDFATTFAALQTKRHIADYDPLPNPMLPLTRSEALRQVDAAEAALRAFRSVPLRDRRAFAVWVLLRPPRT